MPAKFRPYGALAQTSSPHFSSEKGGLAMTQSKVARLSPAKNAGWRSVSPRTTWKSEGPCRNRFIRAMAEGVRFFRSEDAIESGEVIAGEERRLAKRVAADDLEI